MSESKREGGKRTTLQTLAHCHCSTARGQSSSGSSGSGYDGGGRPHRPSAAQSPTLTASLWDHPAKLGAKREKKEKTTLCPSQDQVPDLNSCRTDNAPHTHTHTSLFFPLLHALYTHPHSLKLKHTSLLVAFWTSVFFLFCVCVFFFFLHCLR